MCSRNMEWMNICHRSECTYPKSMPDRGKSTDCQVRPLVSWDLKYSRIESKLTPKPFLSKYLAKPCDLKLRHAFFTSNISNKIADNLGYKTDVELR